MNRKDADKILARMQANLCELIKINGEDIIAAYEEALQEHIDSEKDTKFKFPVSMRAEITGHDTENYDVQVKIRWAVTHTDSITTNVKTGDDLVDQMTEAAGEDEDDPEDDENIDLDAEAEKAEPSEKG